MTTAPPPDDRFLDHIPGNDIPQADNLQRVRLVVDAVAAGAPTQEQVIHHTRVSLRHVSYSLHAARVLGFLSQEGRAFRLTGAGRALCATRRMSEEERGAFREAYARSAILGALAPGLFDPTGPSVEAIAATIERRGRLSPATARRRARALLSWRLQILEPQKYAYLLDAAEGAFVDE
ncbi:MAG: hypothetical protein MUF64_17370 [Polyangiaceae bacterium]|jgi:hypothetical protein|nr:hypothetical protein [Polyangiaceae bacterium]